MTVAHELAAAVRPLLPLRISAAEYNDPQLVVIGEGWSLVLLASWTWLRDNEVLAEWGKPGTDDAVWELPGLELVAIEPMPAGCSFALSDGGSLDVESDRSGWEQWTFSHQDIDLVFVSTD